MNQNPNDRRPTDWAYKATFQQKDLPSLHDMIKKINITHDVGLIEEFNQKCEQRLRGEDSRIEGIEIQTVTKTGDLVVNGGLRHCINIILGTTSARWSRFGMTAGDYPYPAVTDTVLQAEGSLEIQMRVPFAWAEAVGMRLFFGGISSQTDSLGPSFVGEIGVYNGSAAGAVLLNRSLFFPDAATTSQVGQYSEVYAAPIIVSAVIEFCPVA